MSATYTLAPAYATNGITGETVGYSATQPAFDVLAALVAGGGNANGVGGSFTVTDSALIAALDASPTLVRTASSGQTFLEPGAAQAWVAWSDSSGNYPARPSVQGPVLWVGPVAPAGRAQDNDLWFNSTSTVTV